MELRWKVERFKRLRAIIDESGNLKDGQSWRREVACMNSKRLLKILRSRRISLETRGSLWYGDQESYGI